MRIVAVAVLFVGIFSLSGVDQVEAQKRLKGRLCVNNTSGDLIIRKRCRKTETQLDTESLQALVNGDGGDGEGEGGGMSAAVADYERVSVLNSCDGGLLGSTCEATAQCPDGTSVLGGGVSSTVIGRAL